MLSEEIFLCVCLPMAKARFSVDSSGFMWTALFHSSVPWWFTIAPPSRNSAKKDSTQSLRSTCFTFCRFLCLKKTFISLCIRIWCLRWTVSFSCSFYICSNIPIHFVQHVYPALYLLPLCGLCDTIGTSATLFLLSWLWQIGCIIWNGNSLSAIM